MLKDTPCSGGARPFTVQKLHRLAQELWSLVEWIKVFHDNSRHTPSRAGDPNSNFKGQLRRPRHCHH